MKDRHARTLKDTQTDEQEYSIFAIVKPHYIQYDVTFKLVNSRT